MDEEHKDGEIEFILKDLKHESESIMHELMEMEDLLVKMKTTLESGQIINKETLLGDIMALRNRIGVIERIDSKEFGEEKAAGNLLEKLRGMIDKCI